MVMNFTSLAIGHFRSFMLDMEHPFVQSTNNVDFIKEKGKVGVDEGRHTRTRMRTRPARYAPPPPRALRCSSSET